MGNVDELNKFESPIIIQYDKDYQNTLRNKLNTYKEVVEKFAVSDECKYKVISVCDSINCALDNYYNGYTVTATEKLVSIISGCEDNPFLVSTLTNNYAFRGLAPKELRLSDDPAYDKMMQEELYFFKARISENSLTREDMLHIPYDKRSIISTQRFSIPGVPCMYFSTTSFGCWLELSMPEKEYFYCSAYKLPSKWKILNLCIHHSVLQNAMNTLMGQPFNEEEALIVFPFVIATSFRILERNRTFRSEYIISQLLMQAAKIIGLDGIAYSSKRITALEAYPQCVNLAVICDKSTENKIAEYSHKCKEIQLTEPELFSDFNSYKFNNGKIQDKTLVIKHYKNNKGHQNIYIMDNAIKYHESKFALYDEYLVSQEFKTPALKEK